MAPSSLGALEKKWAEEERKTKAEKEWDNLINPESHINPEKKGCITLIVIIIALTTFLI
jgi:hypothetical protein